MADINIGSDALLVTALNDNDRVTITRLATSQQVATMTVADFRTLLCGIDYSMLTEQIVPGEFWIDNDGKTKKQVYRRTFVGSFNSTTATNLVLAYGIRSYEVVHSSILAGAGDSVIDNKVTDEGYIAPGTNTSWTIQNRLETNICQLAIVGQALLNKDLRYVVTLKYTKI